MKKKLSGKKKEPIDIAAMAKALWQDDEIERVRRRFKRHPEQFELIEERRTPGTLVRTYREK